MFPPNRKFQKEDVSVNRQNTVSLPQLNTQKNNPIPSINTTGGLPNQNRLPSLPGSNKQKTNPAMQSLNKFGGMLNENIAQPIAKTLDYGNPVTLAKNVWNKAGQLPQLIKDHDAAYADRVRSDLSQLNQQGSGGSFPTQMNNVQPANNFSDVKKISTPGGQVIPQNQPEVNIQKPLPPGNYNALNGIDQNAVPMPKGHLDPFSNRGLPQLSPQQAEDRKPLGGRNDFDADYVNQHYSRLNNQQANESRYMRNFQDAQNQDSASAEMVNRINRGTAAIKDLNEYKSGTGQYAQSQQGGGLPFVGRRPDKAPKLPEPRSAFTNDSDFNKRHGASLARADAALMNANTNRQRLGNDRTIADNRDQVERERIAAQATQDQDQNQQAINTAQKAAQQQLYSNNMRAKEYQQRGTIAKNKLSSGNKSNPKDTWNKMFSNNDLMSSFDSIDPDNADAINLFNQSSPYTYEEVQRYQNQFQN